MSDAYAQPSREWWVEQWIEVLERIGFTQRLARARNYARQGNVLSIEFKGAKVTAKVQGTAPEPYEVTFSLDRFTDEEWSYVIETMAERAIFSAKLLAGEMPQNIQDVFTANGLSLFPFDKSSIHSRCSCPDPANPCKHIGAVYYLLGDQFGEDPFVIFQLRGRTKDEIINALRQIRSSGEEPTATSAIVRPATPLNPDQFWIYTEQLEPSLIVITPPPSSETVLDVLGALPIKVEPPANQVAMETLKLVYQTVSMEAVKLAMAIGG
ncbi:SWIM zinc finger family protein [Leptolyngbya sp. NIES-2104]|uniref:SWIM zinc finger family protein n=1 Tax=Leptolyngbya sp. NIES-2104 TaxID=1552121 RepID=UPI0006ECCAE6|nr:SWIM zinc finger family protein [Leptolyngbya sp. NIES-2104]GAP98651.1 SWF/SNF family helicase [Leptolyngbya sp. NIES-2104]